MTNEEINAAIAEACGWRDVWRHRDVGTSPDNQFLQVPKYCTDLNAMNEAEKCVEDRDKYLNVLADITEELEFISVENDWLFCRATARQRAEAFLRTLDKWKSEN